MAQLEENKGCRFTQQALIRLVLTGFEFVREAA
jgi:hypothetical protein